MKTATSRNISNKLQELFQLLQKGQIKTVVKEVELLIQTIKSDADVFHLAAIAYKADGNVDQAVVFFQKSIKLKPNHAQVHNNLANAYKHKKNYEKAEEHYKKAIEITPKYTDALKNLGLLYLQVKQFDSSIIAFKQAIKFSGNDISSITGLGNVYKALNDYESAIIYYKKALAINPNYVNALHNLGVTYRMSGDYIAALKYFNIAKNIAPNIAELDFNAANTYFDIGDYDKAEESYWSSLRKSPDNCEVHETLNEFYWQVGRKREFGKSFEMAIKELPTNIPLRIAYAESLLSSGNTQQAMFVVNHAIEIEKTPQLSHLKGKLLASNGDITTAIDVMESSLILQYELSKALDLIELLIIDFQYERALKHILTAESIAPKNQLLIAHKSLCWRLTSDERYEWLIDYEKHIKSYDIPVPYGYSSKTAFLDELKGELLDMHGTQHAPLKQTLKHGTQTPGRLFYKPIKAIIDLKKSFETVSREYIRSLADDKTHPLLSRKTEQVSFAGSWSVKLKPNGYHVNHVHPDGWLSSCFYIHVPEFSQYEQNSKHAGSIKFGESSMNLKEREKVSRIIAPEAGLVAIFPSYAWHGTYPFNAPEDTFRLTAPCDIIPEGE